MLRTNEKIKFLFQPPISASKTMDWLRTISLMATATAISWFFFKIMHNPTSNIAQVYSLAVFLVARFTTGYIYGLVASLIGVICVNFLFTYPFFQLDFFMAGSVSYTHLDVYKRQRQFRVPVLS